jgi:3-oxoacyl-[acyl-carrier-protein] synthase II
LKIAIKGIGVLGGFGCGLTALEEALRTRKILPGKVPMASSKGDIEVPALLADTSALTRYIDRRSLRRTDHYIRMAVLGAHLALEDAGMLGKGRNRTGIIVATGYGATCNTFDFQQSVLNVADPCGSPTKFSNSVHNAAASHISILLDEMGPTLSVSQFDNSVASALLSAVQWLRHDRVDTVLVGGVDEYCKVLGYYWHCRYAADDPGHPTPDKQHVIIGEGACFFVLQKESDPSGSYAVIDDVCMTDFRRGPVDLPEDAVFFLGADGYSECDADYPEILPPTALAAVYTPLYGGLPVGTAFDMAVAALSHRRRALFASSDSAVFESGKLDRIERLHVGAPICCLKLGAGGVAGWITLNGTK